MSVGVIIARFQTDALTQGHRQLIEHVKERHMEILVLLGVAPTQPTKRNPLDFKSRELMVRAALPDATILPLVDCRTNDQWSTRVDAAIAAAFPHHGAVLYGGRDSFIPCYVGKWPTAEVQSTGKQSATEHRQEVAQVAQASEHFRRGMIYATYNRFPSVDPTVDVALLRGDEVLLGRKPGEAGWRFPGGFVDPTDTSLEAAAKRELFEEADIISEAPMQYVGSFLVNEWRTRGCDDLAVMTTLFACAYTYGAPKAGDDLAEVKWVKLGDALDCLVEEHRPLLKTLVNHLN